MGIPGNTRTSLSGFLWDRSMWLQQNSQPWKDWEEDTAQKDGTWCFPGAGSSLGILGWPPEHQTPGAAPKYPGMTQIPWMENKSLPPQDGFCTGKDLQDICVSFFHDTVMHEQIPLWKQAQESARNSQTYSSQEFQNPLFQSKEDP